MFKVTFRTIINDKWVLTVVSDVRKIDTLQHRDILILDLTTRSNRTDGFKEVESYCPVCDVTVTTSSEVPILQPASTLLL
jgi:hypothetical protein